MNKMVLQIGLGVSSILFALGCGSPAPAPPAAPTTPPAAEPSVLLTPEECASKGGETIGDPGDGSTRRNGCPGGRVQLGNVKMGIEGGICCAK